MDYNSLPSWLRSGLSGAMWGLTRPQQMIFRAGRRGADAFSDSMHQYDQQGYSPGASTAIAAARSVPSALGGAFDAINPWSQDVHGGDLTQGLTGNQNVDDWIGTGLDFTADPTMVGASKVGAVVGRMARTARSLAPLRREAMAAAQNTVPQINRWAPSSIMASAEPSAEAAAGTARRTMKSLEGLEGQANRADMWNALDRLGLKKWLLDIPVTPRPGEALAIRHPGSSVERLMDMLDPGSVEGMGALGGAFNPNINILSYLKKTAKDTLPHEQTHWSRWAAPSRDKMRLVEPLEDIFDMYPMEAFKLQQMPAYRGLSDAKIGEEILAREVGAGTRTWSDPLIQSVIDRAMGAIRPQMYQDAARIPLEVPYAAAARWRE